MKRPGPLRLNYQNDIKGRRFAFFGKFEHWPTVLGDKGPKDHVQRRGARVVKTLPSADYVVFGEGRGTGKKAALAQAEKLKARGKGPEQLDERQFLQIARPRIEGCTFMFAGGSSSGLDVEGPAAMIAAAGGVVVPPESDTADFMVIGPGRAKGKAELIRRLTAPPAKDSVQVLSENKLLQLFACLQPAQDSGYDVRALAMSLRDLTDPGKVERGIQMLRKQSFQLHSEVTAQSLRGLVKSQSQRDTVYGCWIHEDGRFGCFDQNLEPCMGQVGDICKHLVVLLLGLSAARQIEPRTAFTWARSASTKNPDADRGPSAEMILWHRGGQAGEMDWRPTETVPEDYYAL